MVHRIKKGVLLAILSISISCNQELTDDPIPYAPFPDIVLTLANYPTLFTDGGYVLLNDGGFRGIILYRKSAGVFRAFERNCSFQPLDACATVDVIDATQRMEDTCCGSSFNFDGNRTGGPAWRPLNQYETIAGSGTVTITDNLIN